MAEWVASPLGEESYAALPCQDLPWKSYRFRRCIEFIGFAAIGLCYESYRIAERGVCSEVLWKSLLAVCREVNEVERVKVPAVAPVR